MYLRTALFTLFFILSLSLFSQQKSKYHSPTKAAIFSAVLPGAGQIYNKKYWKAPIVWGGLGAFTYLYISDNNRYLEAKKSYLSILDSNVVDIPFNGTTNPELVQNSKNIFRNQRDMYLVLGIIFYTLNIVDATVDAHLFKFDVSDDLSLNMDFDMKNYHTRNQVPSLSFNLNIKK